MPMSEQQRKAASDRMKAMHAKKKETNEPKEEVAQETPQSETKVELTQEQFQALMNRLSTLEESKTQTVKETPQGNGFDQFGKPQGIIQKYSVDPAHYGDPRQRLYDLPELQRFAISQNYMLEWDVDQLIYDTKYGTSFSEPKFTLILYKKMFDEDGAQTDKRVVIQRGIFFEDPAASIKEAANLGMPIDNANSREFLEQMRFYRYKQWLMDIFMPQKAVPLNKLREEVIGGKVFEVESYSVVV